VNGKCVRPDAETLSFVRAGPPFVRAGLKKVIRELGMTQIKLVARDR